ncbi:MAG: hypothetical protein D6693_07770 [Planctomycetota bacterium]|nr:MAG: hypothetical protein D6693_07770 [Planctomycetota bacterium]
MVFGVAPIGGPPNPGGPVFIHNNLTDRFDILSSPGNGWLTADTSLTNNIQENGGPLPGFAFRVGGGNVNGPFGAGVATIDAFGNVGFAISDAAPAGGSGSYLIASSITQYQSVGNTVGAVTAALGIAGRLASPLSSLAVSLRIEILDTANVFLGVNSPPQVLAVGGGLNDVALGDFWATQFNPLTGDFLGLSIDTTPVLNIPNGDILTVRTTLTAIGDPSTISSLGLDDPLLAPLLAQSGATIGDLVLSQSVGAPPIPAPATAAIVATLFAGALRRRRAA